MLASRKLLLLGMVAITLVIVYSRSTGTKWVAVNINHYDGKVSAGQEFDPSLLTGTEKYDGRRTRACFNYDPNSLEGEYPVVKAYLRGNISISYKDRSVEEDTKRWQISGGLDGDMHDVIPGEGKVIKGTSHNANGWVIEWWKPPTSPVKVIIITNPNGKSRTFRIEWSSQPTRSEDSNPPLSAQ